MEDREERVIKNVESEKKAGKSARDLRKKDERERRMVVVEVRGAYGRDEVLGTMRAPRLAG